MEAGIANWMGSEARSLLPPWLDVPLLRNEADEECVDEPDTPWCMCVSLNYRSVLCEFQPWFQTQRSKTLVQPIKSRLIYQGFEVSKVKLRRHLVSPKRQDTDLAKMHKAFLLPHALAVAGGCHLMHAVAEQSFEDLEHWPKFFAQLEFLNELFMHQKARLISTCCLMEGDKRVLQSLKLVRLYRKRWHFVALFLEAVAPAMPILKRVWSTAKFGEGGRNLDTAAVSELCVDEMFAMYSKMILTVHHIPKQLTSWMEGCSCHAMQDEKRRKQQIKVELGNESETCPMSGCRSCEMANGKHLELLKAMLEKGKLSLSQAAGALSNQQLATLLSDYAKASGRVELMTRVKLNFWSQLPWRLCALAHWDMSIALRCASGAIDEYDKHPPGEALAIHHRHTSWWLHPEGPLRRDLEEFLRTHTMSPVMEFECMAMRFIPVVERTIERQHIPLGRVGRSKKTMAGATFSLASRWTQLLQQVSTRHGLDAVAAEMLPLRTARGCAEALGLQNHPKVMLALSDGRRAEKTLWHTISTLLYRQDLEMQFARFSTQVLEHREAVAARSKEALQVLGPLHADIPQPHDIYTQLKLKHLGGLLQNLAFSGCLISLPMERS